MAFFVLLFNTRGFLRLFLGVGAFFFGFFCVGRLFSVKVCAPELRDVVSLEQLFLVLVQLIPAILMQNIRDVHLISCDSDVHLFRQEVRQTDYQMEVIGPG